MKIGEKMRKWISMILCLCMLVQNAPMMVFAASTDNLCEHHPKHTEDCGYVEAVAGSACTHKHSEACYKIVECKHTCSDECGDPCTTHTCTVDNGCITMERDCHHVHGECGYAEAVEPQDCTTCQPVLVHAQNCGYVAPVAEETCDCVPGEDGTVTHIEGCGYVAPVEEEKCDCEPTVIHGGEGCTYVEGKDGSPCTHVCAVVVDSADSCYKLLCSHKDGGHDDACGYAAAVEGHACHYECSACEDNAGDDSPVPEGVCAHGNSEENCETCVAEIQVMINALPDMEDITDENRADVISRMEAIDSRKWKLSDAARGKLDFDKYADAAFVLSAPEGFFGFLLTKRYEAGASAMPQASFAFLDASGVVATVITPEEQQTTSVEPVSNGGAVRGYLPVGEYTLDETVVGDWNLTMSVNGQAEGDHTFTGEGGRGYRIETVNVLIHSYITIASHEHGSVGLTADDGEWTGNLFRVRFGETVTLTVEPASGYELGVLEVKSENQEKSIKLTGEGNTYTFEAPDYNVTVTATFKPLCEHTTEEEENKATCSHGTICDNCSTEYTSKDPGNHDASVAFDNGFCPNGCYESAKLVDGVYQISNAGQLYWFAEQVNSSGNYSINGKLMEDILVNENVLNSAGIVSSGPFRTWYPIGSNEDVNYSGTFNGNGKTIGGLYFDDNNEDGVGLFGYVDSGEIQNVGIKDSYFNGRNNVGSVVAHNHKGTVTGCYNTGTVSGGSNVGGVVGKNEAGTVTDCYNSGLIGSYDCNNVGGVLGGNIGTVSNCYNTGLISGQDCVGGVAGYSGGKVSNCYNTGEVYGQNMVGGVLGLNESGSTLSNCYYLTGTANGGINGADAAGKAEAKTTKQFASGEVAALLGEPFGQNIDNSQPKQEIPCFSDAEVYAVKNCKEETVYSNTNENIGHKWENGKCSICDASCSHSGSQHTTATPKDESTHSYICSICSSVATENHTFDSTTGKCQYCKTEMAEAKVEIGDTTTYFETLADAVTKAEAGTAEAPATLTLLKDIDLEDSYQRIDSGVMILDLNGCKLTGSDFYVLDITGNATGKPDVTITDSREGGTISATQLNGHGVRANNSTVTINGGTVSGDGYGVSARQGTVTITGGTISGGAAGVNADSNSTVTISGGTISNGTYGVIADNSTVEITGGTITSTSSGVYSNKSTVEITGGTITSTSSGVYSNKSTVKISGGTITGGNYDLEVSNTDSITLGLGKDGTVATFPGGLNVDGTTLKAILAERAAYWQNGKMISLYDGQTEITDGDVTVEVECKHGNATYPAEYITNTQHKVDCSKCGYEATEDHTFDSTTGKCSACGAREIFFEANVSWNEVYAYYWVDSTQPPKQWPGVELTKNDGDPRYRLFVPGDTAYIVFHDGTNRRDYKTDDLELGVKNCYHYDGNNEYWYTYPCTEHTWGKDGKCSNCQTPCPHNSFNSTTGKCTDCETNIAVAKVEIGGTTPTYFETLDEAVTAAKAGTAEAPATLTLLQDIDLGSEQQITSGVFTLDLNGCKLTGSGSYVLYISGTATGKPDVTITDSKGGGTITGAYFVVVADNSDVNISGGTISGGDAGVYANESSIVTISGGTVTAAGDTITATNSGVHAYNSTVEITGGAISGESFGVHASSNSTVTISGGTISGGDVGVYASFNSTVKISGGTITGGSYDLEVSDTASIILGLGKDGTVATFPGGLNVSGTTLDAVLDEGAAYWKDGKMISLYDGQTEITGGNVTVEVECKHGNATYPAEYITNTQHKVDCPCSYVATENHTFDSTTGKCSACGAREIFFEANVSWNEVYAYYWVDSTQPPKQWPGVELTKNDGDPRYRLFVPGDTAYIVFHDGTNRRDYKTDDLELGVKNCYHYDGNNEYWYTYPCTEHTWGKDGKCSNCRTACPHNSFNSNTGKCTDCETNIAEAMVEIGGTTPTYFKTLAEAVTKAKTGTAEAPATLTLLKNINLGASYQQIDSGVFTLDLNGCTLAGIGSYVLRISGAEVTITDGSEAGNGTISGTDFGVLAISSAVEISGGTVTVTGEDSYGVYAYSNSTVTISGGTISGNMDGVYAENSTVTITGGTISGNMDGVNAMNSTVKISGGTITGSDKSAIGVNVVNSTVEISSGTITGTNYGVFADESAVTITGGDVSGKTGVNVSGGTANISGGTITGTEYGVYASGGTVTITDGSITGVKYGMYIAGQNVTASISGGTITSTSAEEKNYAAVVANYYSTVTITGGEISGAVNDLRVFKNGSITLTLAEGATEGATFPGGLTVYNTTLVDILAEGAAYWQDTKMIFLSDGQTEISDGTVTVKAVCKHENPNYSIEGVTDATKHKVVCPCGYENLEDHTFDNTDGKCSKCKTDLAEASVEIGETTYYETLGAAITAAESCVEADNAVVTLLKDIALGTSYPTISSGVITLDLNGCTLEGIGECVLHVSGAEVTITDGSEAGTGTISGTGTTTSSGCDGVRVHMGTLTIKNGTISGTSDGVYVRNGNLSVAGGTISGYCGVFAYSNSTVKISGGEISGTEYGVYAEKSSEVEISGGTISGTNYGVNVWESTVTIKDGTITGTESGVHVWDSTVTISGGDVSGEIGVNVSGGTANISGGTITGVNFGVGIAGTATISGGTITSTGTENNIYAAVVTSGTVTITGGEISGAVNDLRVDGTDSSITLGLGENDIGATFPEGLTVYNTTLVDILGESAAYWQGTKMLTNIADDAITITGGTVTVKAPCKHTDVTYPDEHITDTHHTLVCSCGYVVATESHTRTYTASGNVITASCSQCKATFGTATITANGKTYNGEPVTAAVQKTGVLTDSSIGITYSQNGEELNESAIRAGTYTASIKLGDAVAKVNFTITPATLPNAVLSETGYTYNGQQQKPAVTVTGLTENTDYTVTYPQDVTNAGEKTVTITGKGNYTGTVTKSYSIAKADSAVTKAPQAAANLVYNGKNQNLVIAGTVTGGTLQYSLDGKTWTATIPVGKAAGTYTVSYKVVGDANHKDIAVRTLAVTIAKGTAPAVDALVQTHFYAYATANTVDLAKYLPADRGTTAYTAIGISADIFSSVLTVTNAGVLSYTTRKLTAAPASDTQISIKVVMENYADAELTVTVKLLAVTEQTQQKIVKTELTEVPAGLAGTRFHSVNAIKTEQKRVLGLQLGYDPQDNIIHYDVKLQFSPDGGKTWVDATEENFPANGLTVTLPYPSGTGKDTHNFVVSHMFTTGAKAGTIETPAVTKTAEGIQFTVTGLSPVSVAWSAIPFDVNVANVTNGTVYVSSAQATAGTQVTITATPKSGYRLSTLTVKDAAGNFCVVSTDNNGKYYFTMPAADVTVTATFTAKSTAVADTTNPKTGDDSNLVFWNSMAMTSLLALAVLMLNKKKLYQK